MFDEYKDEKPALERSTLMEVIGNTVKALIYFPFYVLGKILGILVVLFCYDFWPVWLIGAIIYIIVKVSRL